MTAAVLDMPCTLDGLVASAIEATGGEWNAAVDLMMRWLNDPSVERPLRAELQLTALRYLVRQHAHAQRAAAGVLCRPAPRPDDPSGIRGMARAFADLYAYPLEGGLMLGDATRADVERQIARHDLLASSNATKARWFRSFLGRLTDDAMRVRDVLSATELAALKDAAENVS